MANQMIFFMFLASLMFVVSGRSLHATIKTNDGQIFECVDFNKQSAFGNSSLNTLDMSNIAKVQQLESINGFGLNGACPIGSVPILDRSHLKATQQDVPNEADVLCNARVQTRANNPNKKFFGANAHINIYKPLVQGSQWSSARIKLLNGGESIEAGWMVNPTEFKDGEAHLYASFRAGDKGCINLDCSGFVQVSTALPLGLSPHQYSVYGGQQIGWNISIDKHQDDGNWWLSITSAKHQIGYWPKNLFTTLSNVANQVEFGGEINNPGKRSPLPGMGNGRLAQYDTQYSSCFVHATTVDESFKNINPPDTEKFLDCNIVYSILDGGYQGDLGRLIFYGGPI